MYFKLMIDFHGLQQVIEVNIVAGMWCLYNDRSRPQLSKLFEYRHFKGVIVHFAVLLLECMYIQALYMLSMGFSYIYMIPK